VRESHHPGHGLDVLNGQVCYLSVEFQGDIDSTM
jgi:hypothetical protein